MTYRWRPFSAILLLIAPKFGGDLVAIWWRSGGDPVAILDDLRSKKRLYRYHGGLNRRSRESSPIRLFETISAAGFLISSMSLNDFRRKVGHDPSGNRCGCIVGDCERSLSMLCSDLIDLVPISSALYKDKVK